MPGESTLTLYIPDLFGFQSTLSKVSKEELSQLPEIKLPVLEKWLSRGFREEFMSLRVHPKVAIASILIAAVAWLMSGIVSEICWNITILFVVLYTFVGAAILHAVFSSMKTRRFMVPFMYITLVLVPHMIAVVVIVGILDVWLDLRTKILNKTRT